MFLHVSVSHSVHGGGSASVHAGIPPPGADTPLAHPPSGTLFPPLLQSMLGDAVNARTVQILLECNLVAIKLTS